MASTGERLQVQMQLCSLTRHSTPVCSLVLHRPRTHTGLQPEGWGPPCTRETMLEDWEVYGRGSKVKGWGTLLPQIVTIKGIRELTDTIALEIQPIRPSSFQRARFGCMPNKDPEISDEGWEQNRPDISSYKQRSNVNTVLSSCKKKAKKMTFDTNF